MIYERITTSTLEPLNKFTHSINNLDILSKINTSLLLNKITIRSETQDSTHYLELIFYFSHSCQN